MKRNRLIDIMNRPKSRHYPLVYKRFTEKELEDALTFLLSSGVITTKQFTEYRNKALPFTKG